MKSFLDQEFLSNTIRDYLWVAGVILIVVLLQRFLSKYIALFLCRALKRAWKTFDQQKFTDLIVYPLGVFLVISITNIALYRLSYPQEFNITIYKHPIQNILLSLAKMVHIGAFTWLLLRFIDFVAAVLEMRANRTQALSDNQLIVFFRDFFKVMISIIGGMMILHFAFNYDVSSLLTGLSIVGAAIALALRESLENLIASFVIFFDKPFTTGDFVRVQNVAGSVERIGLRSTRMRTVDKSYITVPNKQMVDSILDNVSLRSQIRGELNLFINLQTTPEKIRLLSDEIKNYLSGVKEVSSYNVLFNDIRVQAFIVFIEFFTPPMEWSLFLTLRQQLNFHVLQTMEKLEIKIAAEGKEISISS
jgi:MscS family membrane protein